MLRYLTTWRMPQGDPADWNLEQETQGDFLAKNFAEEYVRDFNAASACIRLGCPERDAITSGRLLKNHPVVVRFIEKITKEFSEINVVTEDTMMAMLYKEAKDENNNAAARVRAQEQLAKMMGFIGDGRVEVNVSANATPLTRAELEMAKEVFDDNY